MKQFLILVLVSIPSLFFAQEVLSVKVSKLDNAALEHLNESTYFKENTYQNHVAVDLVEAYTVDSTFTRKFERHRVVGGGLIRLLGYSWKAVSLTRQKIVGWVNRTYLHDINSAAQFTEYDINYDLIPTLPKYVDLAYDSYQLQFNMKKSKKKDQEGQAPFIYPAAGADMTNYRFHCENTPASKFRSLLNTVFYPVHRNNNLTKHHNFKDEHPVMGMYGVLTLDCNHNCHPEIHPYEWIWWLNLTEERSSWNIGFMRDVSNRFKHWSTSPRTGQITLPFNFPLDAENWTLEFDHQLFSNFNEEGFLDLVLDASYQDFGALERTYTFDHPLLKGRTLTVKSNLLIPYKSIQYALANLKIDESANSLSGQVKLVMSIEDLYTGELKMEYDKATSDYSQLLQLMEGSFTSKIQALQDTAYEEISLKIYPIWEDQGAGWFYVEQAVSGRSNKPYKQEIYKVDQIDAATFKSAIYRLPNDSLAIGKWKEPSFFDQWDPANLELKEGCEVYLKKVGKQLYEGSTLTGTCLSDFKGAKYATSKVKINALGIDSWEQGFDENQEQLWGAKKGPYQFRKLAY